jgi:NitT/TauT family transport system substrate-binding protein
MPMVWPNSANLRATARQFIAIVATIVVNPFAITAANAEAIKVGVVRVAAFAPLYIAQERGYFAAEGVPAEIVTFDAAQPVAVAVVAGSTDFGVAALTAGFYNLAGQGALKVIAAAASEHPGFQNQAYLVSTRAPGAADLHSIEDLPGHSFAVTGQGAPPVYVLGGLVAAKYGFDFKRIQLQFVQSIPNVVSSLVGGQSDASLSALTGGLATLIGNGSLRLMGWVGDDTPWQFGAAFTSTRMATERRDTVEKFLRAYRRAAGDYYRAFADQDGRRKDGATAPEVMAILAKYTNQSIADVKLSIPYIDADARLDVKDVLHQIGWYQSQGFVKPDVVGKSVIDERSAIPLR